jgi:hypothetical protein
MEVELNLRGHMEVSELQPVNGMIFRRVPPTHRSNYHPAPRRQYVVTLAGQVEIETGDGTVRRFGPGDVMLADDTTGHGHITRVIGGQPRDCIMIPLSSRAIHRKSNPGSRHDATFNPLIVPAPI